MYLLINYTHLLSKENNRSRSDSYRTIEISKIEIGEREKRKQR